MKKVVVLGPCQAGLAEVPDPRAKEDWALVKVHVAPMCTEYKHFQAGRTAEHLGHEAAGEVVEVAQAGKVKVGDRVVAMPLYGCGDCYLCNSGDFIHCQSRRDYCEIHGNYEGMATYGQYILKQDWLLLPIPDDLSYEKGGLACCGLGPSFGAMQAMNVNSFDTVLIAGAGPVGLGATVNARFRGAKVIVVESNPYRVDIAQKMGATVVNPKDPDVLQQIMALTNGVGVDCGLDCAGVVAAQRLLIDATRRRGQVCFIGECSDDLPIRISPDMLRKGLILRGIWHFNLADYPKVVKVIRESPIVDLLISHTVPMSKIQEAFELSASNQNAKIMMHPWE